MTRVLRFAAIPVGALALAALVGAIRRESLAETPGAVVESFLRHLANDRVEKARSLLTSDLGQTVAADALELWENEAAGGLGELEKVRGQTEWISGDEAEATGVLQTNRRERRLRFLLRRDESGDWAISRLDRFWSGSVVPDEAPVSFRVRESWRERGPGVPRRRQSS